ICNFIFIPMMGISGSALAMVLAYVIVCSLNMWMVKRKAKVQISIVKQFAKPTFCTLIMGVGLYVVLSAILTYLPNDASRLTFTLLSLFLCLFAMIIYVIALLLTRTIGEQELRLLPMGTKWIQIFKKLKLIKPQTLSS